MKLIDYNHQICLPVKANAGDGGGCGGIVGLNGEGILVRVLMETLGLPTPRYWRSSQFIK